MSKSIDLVLQVKTLDNTNNFDVQSQISNGITTDKIELANGSYINELVSSNLTQDRSIQLPNANGVLSIINNAEILSSKTLISPLCDQLLLTNSGFNNTLQSSTLSANKTINFPAIDGTVSLIDNTETLTNKSLTSPVCNNVLLSNSGYNLTLQASTLSSAKTLSFPNITDTIATLTASQNLTNKFLDASTSNYISFYSNSGTSGNTARIAAATLTANRTFSLPDVGSDTFCLIGATQTLTNKSLTDPTFTGVLRLADGNTTNPSFAFTNNLTTGIFHSNSNGLSLQYQGSEKLRIAAYVQPVVRICGTGGSVGTPAYSFSGDTNVGLYLSNTDELSISSGSKQTAAFGNTNINFYNPITNTGQDYIEIYKTSTQSCIHNGSTEIWVDNTNEQVKYGAISSNYNAGSGSSLTITIGTNGVYLISAYCELYSSIATTYNAIFYAKIDGNENIQPFRETHNTVLNEVGFSPTKTMYLTAGQTIKFVIFQYQTSGSASITLNYNTTSKKGRFCVAKLF